MTREEILETAKKCVCIKKNLSESETAQFEETDMLPL